MNISEMHVWFRQYAQQMGMQNVRAILPEQIDNLINTSIKDTIDGIVRNNVGTTNDRTITDNSKLANINALRTLYKVKTIDVTSSRTIYSYRNEPYEFDSDQIGAALYFVDFSIKYNSGTATRWFPIRIIDDSYLSDVLNDWVLAPRMRTPVMVIYKAEDAGTSTLEGQVATARETYNQAAADYAEDPSAANATAMEEAREALAALTKALDQAVTANVELTKFEIYFGENDPIDDIATNATIDQIRCSYIKKPNKVRYVSDIGGDNIDSDLPEQLQIPMLKHAVDLYRASVSGNLFANQENARENQREMVRNQARPENEGYQS